MSYDYLRNQLYPSIECELRILEAIDLACRKTGQSVAVHRANCRVLDAYLPHLSHEDQQRALETKQNLLAQCVPSLSNPEHRHA